MPGLDRPGGAAVRAENLLAFLRARPAPALLLVGEAPGYRGCRFSGIPFTSERSLPLERRTSLRPAGWVEPSATIVQRTLARLARQGDTLLWNVFPFHPMAPGDPLTNRRPTAAELREGRAWLDRLLGLVRPAQVVAVGRVAGDALHAGNVIRHPSHGGARRFEQELFAVLLHAAG